MMRPKTLSTVPMMPMMKPAWAMPRPDWVPPEASISFLPMWPRMIAGMAVKSPQQTRPTIPRIIDHRAFWFCWPPAP